MRGRVLVGALVLVALAGCDAMPLPPGRTPLPPPTPVPSSASPSPSPSAWTAWLAEQGVEVLPERRYLSFETVEYRVVRVRDAAALRTFAEALEAENHKVGPSRRLVVTAEAPVGKAISAVRLVPGEVTPEVLAVATAPVPGDAELRLVGFDDVKYLDPHHQGPQQGFTRKAYYFGGDVADVMEGVELPEGWEAAAIDTSYADLPDTESNYLGDPFHAGRAASVAGLKRYAAAIRELRAAGFEPVRIQDGSVALASEQQALDAAEAFPDTPLGLSFRRQDRRSVQISADPASPRAVYPGYEEFKYQSPTRAELIDFLRTHPNVSGGSFVGRLDFHVNGTSNCESLLAAPPAWTSEIPLMCTFDSGARVAATAVPKDLAEVFQPRRELAELVRGLVSVGDRYVTLQMTDSSRMREAFVKLRAIGWSGSVEVHIEDKSAGERGEDMKLLSTDTGKGDPQYPVRNDFQRRVMELWDQTATS